MKAWRDELGISQVAAAARAGVSQNTWCDWETGRKRPSIDKVATLARLTSASQHAVTLHDFLETDEEKAERQTRRKKAS